jgi:hypothetical protein
MEFTVLECKHFYTVFANHIKKYLRSKNSKSLFLCAPLWLTTSHAAWHNFIFILVLPYSSES